MAFTVAEHLALIALDPTSGKIQSAAGSALPHALAGAIVIDLVAAGSLVIGDDERLSATDVAPPEPSASSAAWDGIRGVSKARTVKQWVAKPSLMVKHPVDAVYGDLVTQGVLRDDGKRTPLSRERYEVLDDAPRTALLVRLGAVLDGTEHATATDISLLALVPPCRLTKVIRPDVLGHTTAKRMKELVEDSALDHDIAIQVARSAAGAAMAAIAGAAAAG